jgi:hypothetical protein
MGDLYDAPNQQVVRADGSAPWEEGTGGSTPPEVEPTKGEQSELDAMTKDELLAKAQELGVSPANAAMSKAEIREGIDAKLAENPA